MISSCYVFVADGATPLICGQYALEHGIGHFSYGRSWLQAADAFALDPINLPLSEREFTFTTPGGVIGVLSDAAPDSWGRRLQQALHRQQPANEVEWLLATSGCGAGCLLFSPARSQAPLPPPPPPFEAIRDFIALAEQVERGQLVSAPPEWRYLLDYGSSMGGAKPKLVVEHSGHHWIAKLNRHDDTVDVALIEYATHLLAQAAGLDVVNMKYHRLAGRSVVLVQRFDRDPLGRRHYLSAHSLLNVVRLREEDARTVYSYGGLADRLRQIGTDVKPQLHELYRRMVFNALVGNTDDHSRNHGVLKDRERPRYRLAPAFDVVPQLGGTRLHGLGLGDDGRLATLPNLLSQAPRFMLTPLQAQDEVARLATIVNSWRTVFARVGVSPRDCQAMVPAFQLIDELNP